MTSPLTDSIPEVCTLLLNKFAANAATLGINAVDMFYGDQTQLPHYPALCVEPGPKDQDYRGATRLLNIQFTVYVIVYLGVVQSVQLNAVQVDEVSRKVETLIHQDPTLKNGGPDQKLIDLLVKKVEPGYATKEKSIVRASRLTTIGRSQSILPSAS
jgi:hypothetical protein